MSVLAVTAGVTIFAQRRAPEAAARASAVRPASDAAMTQTNRMKMNGMRFLGLMSIPPSDATVWPLRVYACAHRKPGSGYAAGAPRSRKSAAFPTQRTSSAPRSIAEPWMRGWPSMSRAPASTLTPRSIAGEVEAMACPDRCFTSWGSAKRAAESGQAPGLVVLPPK